MAIDYALNTLYTLFSITLIVLMVPGFAMLEAGLVRTKNVSSVLTVNVMIYAVASMAFLLVGYNLAFGGIETWWRYLYSRSRTVSSLSSTKSCRFVRAMTSSWRGLMSVNAGSNPIRNLDRIFNEYR